MRAVRRRLGPLRTALDEVGYRGAGEVGRTRTCPVSGNHIALYWKGLMNLPIVDPGQVLANDQ